MELSSGRVLLLQFYLFSRTGMILGGLFGIGEMVKNCIEKNRLPQTTDAPQVFHRGMQGFKIALALAFLFPAWDYQAMAGTK
jgi:hypothetical protein